MAQNSKKQLAVNHITINSTSEKLVVNGSANSPAVLY